MSSPGANLFKVSTVLVCLRWYRVGTCSCVSLCAAARCQRLACFPTQVRQDKEDALFGTFKGLWPCPSVGCFRSTLASGDEDIHFSFSSMCGQCDLDGDALSAVAWSREGPQNTNSDNKSRRWPGGMHGTTEERHARNQPQQAS